VRWGTELRPKEGGYFQEVLHHTDDHVYLTTLTKGKLHIVKLDKDLNTVYDEELPLKVADAWHELERIVFLGDHVVIFTSVYSRKEKLTILYKRNFDDADMRPQGPPEKIYQVQAEGRKNTGGFDVYISPDRQRMLLKTFQPWEENAPVRMDLRLYDADLQLINERIVQLPYPDERFMTESVILDDDGTVMVLGILYDEKHEAKVNRKKGDATYTYHLLVVPPDDMEPADHVIDVRDKFLQDMTFAIGETGDIVCGGFYGNTNEWNIRGAYFLKLDRSTKAISHQSFKEFDDDFITSYMTEKEANKLEKDAAKKDEDLQMYSFELSDIVLREDGGAVFVGEQSYDIESCYTDSKGNTRCVTLFFNNDIVVINIDPDGEIEWARKVPKRQRITGTVAYSSYALCVVEDKIYFVFNDSNKNFPFSEGGDLDYAIWRGKDPMVSLVTVEYDGTTHREALLATDLQDAIISTVVCRQVDDDRMFIYATRGKIFQYGYITFQ